MATLLLRRTRPTSFKPFLTLQSSQPFQAFHTVKLHTRPLAHLTGLTLGFTTLTYTTTPSAILRCDGAPMTSSSSPSSSITSTAADSIRSYQSDAKTPVVKSGQGRLNPKAVKQISAGSICGVVGGLAVSAFSKPLAVLVGLLVFGVQALESRGIHLIPYNRLGRYFKDANVKGLVRDNAAFKLCFGLTFALAAFAEF